jgi:hypothetical protein
MRFQGRATCHDQRWVPLFTLGVGGYAYENMSHWSRTYSVSFLVVIVMLSSGMRLQPDGRADVGCIPYTGLANEL